MIKLKKKVWEHSRIFTRRQRHTCKNISSTVLCIMNMDSRDYPREVKLLFFVKKKNAKKEAKFSRSIFLRPLSVRQKLYFLEQLIVSFSNELPF